MFSGYEKKNISNDNWTEIYDSHDAYSKQNSDMIMENKEEAPKPADAEDPLLKTAETDPETK